MSDLTDRAEQLLAGITIAEYPNYRVYTDGTVWSVGTDWRGYGMREMKQIPDMYGYLKVRLTNTAGRRKISVHQIVAESFLGPRPTPGHQVRHLNGCRSDNRAINLAWGTAADNARDRDRHGMTVHGVAHVNAKLSPMIVRESRARFRSGESIKAIARSFGVCDKTMADAISGRTWAHV
ncbi:HNH endonuclease [Gordonia sp. ABSL49_1]|uniref:HNH endonuclease n=1 Tax=Gordonia sp. ABSL49_1 TaxID=2920941 RepID=UPI001F0E51FA|nr:HNH endonuclease [Gordonia sp. ABSL49_1]MCH5645131.1 HNH endonuclease [Gordonia sp. ABSL49_1]